MSSSAIVEPITDVLTATGLFLVTDTLQTPSAGFLGHILTLAIRQNECVVLVSVGASRPYYLGLTRRLGINLPALEESGLVRFIDYTSYLEQADTIRNANPDSIDHWTLPLFSLPLFDDRKQWILFEDLTALVYWGIPVKDVLRLVHQSLSLVYESNGCVVATVHADDVGDVGAETLMRLLVPSSQWMYMLRTLSSGATLGVDGQLDVTSGPRHPDPRPVSRELLFKITDSGATCFPRGLSHGVI
ncbi:hypothetical protein SeLEV6574_g00596 [Synchytrium endobioticum]|nr:hypothetical protein SeLEV6574_g00596 [Synchytrium endobioticum]